MWLSRPLRVRSVHLAAHPRGDGDEGHNDKAEKAHNSRKASAAGPLTKPHVGLGYWGGSAGRRPGLRS